MPPPSTSPVITVDVPLLPEELIAAWRPESRRLVFDVREPFHGRPRVQARISAVGLGVAATITGRVVRAHRHEGLFRVEVAPDDTRVRALERLVAVAAGAPADYRPRAPRFLATIPVVVQGPGGPTYMTTFAVSENGCGLAWTGPMPAVGVPLEIRLGAGSQIARLWGQVRWTSPSRRAPTVGLHFAAGERSAWSRMLAALRGAGAPPA